MAIPIKKSSAATSPAQTSLPKEVQSQIANNTKLDTTDYTAVKTEPAQVPASRPAEKSPAESPAQKQPQEAKTPASAQTPIVTEQPAPATTAAAPVPETTAPAEEKGKRSDDVVQLKFSKGKRAEAKAFFALYDVKMNAGFEMAYEFLKEEVEAGRVKLSKSGIKRVDQ